MHSVYRRFGFQMEARDRKSTRLNSSHEWISYADFCLKKKKTMKEEGNIIKKQKNKQLKSNNKHNILLTFTLLYFFYYKSYLLSFLFFFFFFFNDTATTEIYTLSLHDALPISAERCRAGDRPRTPLSA